MPVVAGELWPRALPISYMGDPFGAGNAGIAVAGTLGRISEPKE